jgi:hypothetical protein
VWTRGWVEVLLYSSMTAALEGGTGQQHSPAAFYPRERPDTHCTGGWVGPRAGLDKCGKSPPTGIRSPRRPARSQSLYRLSYTADIYIHTRNKINFLNGYWCKISNSNFNSSPSSVFDIGTIGQKEIISVAHSFCEFIALKSGETSFSITAESRL